MSQCEWISVFQVERSTQLSLSGVFGYVFFFLLRINGIIFINCCRITTKQSQFRAFFSFLSWTTQWRPVFTCSAFRISHFIDFCFVYHLSPILNFRTTIDSLMYNFFSFFWPTESWFHKTSNIDIGNLGYIGQYVYFVLYGTSHIRPTRKTNNKKRVLNQSLIVHSKLKCEESKRAKIAGKIKLKTIHDLKFKRNSRIAFQSKANVFHFCQTIKLVPFFCSVSFQLLQSRIWKSILTDSHTIINMYNTSYGYMYILC